MSRSYKFPIYKDHNKDSKRIANHKVRRVLNKMLSFSKGNWYRKIFSSYDICDYKIFPWNEEQKEIAKRK